jgi:2-keto-4-pentenoate hydratase/2-oxohepta-3-ene-1,7-dioic acid hydratase in catechol pathway
MKLASFEIQGRQTYGIKEGNLLREPGDEFRSRFPDLRSVLAGNAVAQLGFDDSREKHEQEKVSFLPLIPNPDKIICVGVNYRPHIQEMGREVPDYPVVFVRFPGSQTGHGQPVIRPKVSTHFDFEGELAIVIGKPARHVPREEAFGYIAGYCCFMDGSVRDWQKHTMQFTAGKNFEQSGSMGPWLVTRDEIPAPAVLNLTTRVNGEVMQQGAVADLVFDIPALIEYCSTFTELLPGDVIATGTPGGVGAARKPPQWLKEGDQVEVDIPGVGFLSNPVKDEFHSKAL